VVIETAFTKKAHSSLLIYTIEQDAVHVILAAERKPVYSIL